jgi:sugar O-acyltransferase (sialic acid O-acetyltransferase NeuD family)
MKTDNKKILIFGAGGHGIVVADIIRTMCSAQKEVSIRGFLDDDADLFGKTIFGFPVLGSVDQLAVYPDDDIIVAVGENSIRKKIVERVKQQGGNFFTAVHPKAIVSDSSEISEGCMVCAGVVVNPEARIGKHVILNTGSSVDHHNNIGNFVHLAPGVHLGGNVTINEGTMVGIGSSIIPSIKIGKWAMIGAGSVVTRDVDEKMVACGNPARSVSRT